MSKNGRVRNTVCPAIKAMKNWGKISEFTLSELYKITKILQLGEQSIKQISESW